MQHKLTSTTSTTACLIKAAVNIPKFRLTSGNDIMASPIVDELSRSHKYSHHVLMLATPHDTSNTVVTDTATNTRNTVTTNAASNNKHTKKRKHDHQSSLSCCFEIRPSRPKNNENGIFAVRNISCGSLIIAHEDPIVSTTTRASPHFCNTCATPIGSLRDHLLASQTKLRKAASSMTATATTTSITAGGAKVDSSLVVDLPCGISAKKEGPVFTTTVTNPSESCTTRKHAAQSHHDGKMVAWCSTKCRDQPYNGGGQQLAFLCRFDRNTASGGDEEHNIQLAKDNKHHQALDDFYKGLAGLVSPMAFQLAAKAITLVLSTMMEHVTLKLVQRKLIHSNSNYIDIDIDIMDPQSYYWWLDYGSHPLWWEVGSNAKERKEQTKEFCQLLKSLLLGSVEQQQITSIHADNSNDDMNVKRSDVSNSNAKVKDLLVKTVESICSMDHVGAILGVFQCNAMGFQYMSPVQQYMERVGQLLSSMPDDDDDDDAATQTFYDGLDWLADNVHAPNGNGIGEIAPVAGSGLYPLLTLANHDCDRNASIEFLQESNRGSMVALRDIVAGEEICLSYVPIDESNNDCSSDDDDDDDLDIITKNFQLTRTAKWLSQQIGEPQIEIDEERDEGDIDVHSVERSYDDIDNEDQYSVENISGVDDDENETNYAEDEEDFPLTESNVLKERSKAVMEYGFECHCKRCQHELAKPGTPYSRNDS